MKTDSNWTTLLALGIFFISSLGRADSCVSDPSKVLDPASQKSITALVPALSTHDDLTPNQEREIEQMTSVFENSTTDFVYDYIEDIKDHNGITLGRVGFNRDEILDLVSAYVQAKGPHTPLAKWIPCLKAQGEKLADDYSCLFPDVSKKDMATDQFKSKTITQVDFGADWVAANKDPIMRGLQDQMVDQGYFQPAMQLASKLNIHTVLGRAMIYDMFIQMGSDTAAFPAIERKFASTHHGRIGPANRDEEVQWMKIYLTERRKTLRSMGEAYVHAPSREGAILGEVLTGFKGVLVSDYYPAYDSVDCRQQRCLIHLIRDLNDDLFKNPFDAEYKDLVMKFGGLLKAIMLTIDRRGLKSRYLQHHKITVEDFYRSCIRVEARSELVRKVQARFEKNEGRLFTFLDHDGIPWNNNNAENAIKGFATLRRVIGGSSTEKGLKESLTLLSIHQTLRNKDRSSLDFFRSGEISFERYLKASR